MATENVITELGVGGILAILLIRETFNFIQSRDKGSKNGDSRQGGNPKNAYASRGELEELADRMQPKEVCVQIVGRLQTKIEDGQKVLASKMDSMTAEFEQLKELIRSRTRSR